MGRLVYGSTRLDLSDTALAKTSMLTRELLRESNDLIVIEASHLEGRAELFVTPGVPLQFLYDSPDGADLTDEDLDQLREVLPHIRESRTVFVLADT